MRSEVLWYELNISCLQCSSAWLSEIIFVIYHNLTIIETIETEALLQSTTYTLTYVLTLTWINLRGVVLKMPADGELGSMLDSCVVLVGVAPP